MEKEKSYTRKENFYLLKGFLWKNYSAKIKHETLCNDYKGVGLKNINILNRVISLQCWWIRRLYNNSVLEQELILLFSIKNPFGNSIKFHSNLFFKRNKIKLFFHLSIGKSFYTEKTILPESPYYNLYFVLISYNENIQSDKNLIYFVWFSEQNVNYISQLF